MEITANAIQTVAAGQDIIFTDTAVPGNFIIMHRPGSGLIALRGITRGQARARFQVSFGANVALATGATATSTQLAIALEGEAISTSTMITTAAVGEYNNVYASLTVDVPVGCCLYISVKNLTTDAVDVQNANLTVNRIA